MALIKCPECGQHVSSLAKNCIHCGFPIDSIMGAKCDKYELKRQVIMARSEAICTELDKYKGRIQPRIRDSIVEREIKNIYNDVVGKTDDEIREANDKAAEIIIDLLNEILIGNKSWPIHIREHILKSGKKSYEYRFEASSVDGKRQWITKRGFKTKTEAKRAGLQAQQQYENIGTVISPSEMSFSDYLDMWMKEDCMVDRKQTTITGYQKKIKNYIKPALGIYPLKAIKKEHLQAFVVEMYDKGYSRNTISGVMGILSNSMNYAVDHNYLLFSPAVRLKIPKNRVPRVPTRSQERKCIPPDVVKAIMARFPETSSSHIPLRLGYECGLRKGEAFALVWEDVDLEKQTITINRQVQWHKDPERTKVEMLASNGSAECGNGYWYFSSPKYDSVRKITMSDKLTELLRREKARQAAMREYYGEHYTVYHADNPLYFDGRKPEAPLPVNAIREGGGGYPVHFVCVRGNGTYVAERTLQYTSKIIQNEIYEEFTYHALRHTHASKLYEAGLNEKFISERMGHKDDRVTRAVYIHLTDQSREQGRETVNQIYNALDY